MKPSRSGHGLRSPIASADFLRATELQYPYRYLRLWRYLAERREVEALNVEQELRPRSCHAPAYAIEQK